MTSAAVRMPDDQQQSVDDVTGPLRRASRDQDGGCGGVKTAGGTAALSLRLSTLAPLGGLDAHRRRRTAFTSDQLLELEKEFHSKKYLSLTERSQLAHDLQLSEVRYGKGSDTPESSLSKVLLSKVTCERKRARIEHFKK